MAHKKSTDHVAFGAAVRAMRSENYSQEAFADACGIDRSYMGGVERGERNLSLSNILLIIDALKVQPSEFFKALDRKSRQSRISAKDTGV